jgi:hypothetical protein
MKGAAKSRSSAESLLSTLVWSRQISALEGRHSAHLRCDGDSLSAAGGEMMFWGFTHRKCGLA